LENRSGLDVRSGLLRPAPLSRRQDLARWLAIARIPEDRRDDILVVASELISDAVAHEDSAPMSVRAWAYDGGLSLEVVTFDAGHGDGWGLREQPFVAAWRSRIINRMTNECTRTAEGVRRTVRCRFSL
jgi:hypothetical protein